MLVQEPQSVSQSVSQEKIEKNCGSVNFLFLLYRPSRVFLWIATAYMACLSVYDANGAL